MKWALLCTEHLGEYHEFPQEAVISSALEIGHRWSEGNAKTGEAMKASREVHVFARTVGDKPTQFYCRAVAQAVATAHICSIWMQIRSFPGNLKDWLISILISCLVYSRNCLGSYSLYSSTEVHTYINLLLRVVKYIQSSNSCIGVFTFNI
jgi:hypothetical protein